MNLSMRIIAALSMTSAVAAPAGALPKWTRQYDMPCSGCHSVPPRLNDFGKTFQANNFVMPGAQLTLRREVLPISGIATFSAERNLTKRDGSADFRTLKLFAVDPILLGGSRSGVY